MIATADGLILRQQDYLESSIILKVFTREYGLISLLAKGAKRSKKNSYGILRPIHFLNFIFYYSPHKTLFTLKDYQLLFAPNSLEFGIYNASLCFFTMELLLNTITEEGQPDQEKFDFLIQAYQKIRFSKPSESFYLVYMTQLLQILGYRIEPEYISQKECTDSILLLQELTIENELPLIEKKLRQKIYRELHEIYKNLIPNFKDLKSVETLEMLF